MWERTLQSGEQGFNNCRCALGAEEQLGEEGDDRLVPLDREKGDGGGSRLGHDLERGRGEEVGCRERMGLAG